MATGVRRFLSELNDQIADRGAPLATAGRFFLRVSEHSRSSPCFGKCTLDDLHGWNAKAGATYFRVAPVCCPEVGEPSLVDGGAFFFSDGERAAPPPVSLGGKGRGEDRNC